MAITTINDVESTLTKKPLDPIIAIDDATLAPTATPEVLMSVKLISNIINY